MRKAQQTRSLIAAWFDFLPPAEAPIAHAIHKAVRSVAPELTETIRQGNLLMSLDGEPLLAIAPARNQVHLLIFNGLELEAELGALESLGRRQRVVRFPDEGGVDVEQVECIVRLSVGAARGPRPGSPTERS